MLGLQEGGWKYIMCETKNTELEFYGILLLGSPCSFARIPQFLPHLETLRNCGFVLFESIVAAAFPRLSLLLVVGRFNLDKLDFLERFAFETPLSENTTIPVALCWMPMMKRIPDQRIKLCLLPVLEVIFDKIISTGNYSCSVSQILVNKSDKSDHPHQREPWCFAEVVNTVGAAAMPTLQ